jgi:hypothetical protein
MNSKYFSIFILAILFSGQQFAQNIWDVSTYPDESGFTLRMAPMLQRIANEGYAERSLSRSRCPDTGLPVTTWALEGETIFSPYTGRAYKQGAVGYFGALERNEKGEIIRFSGDPLKKELPPATAALLLDNSDEKARGFLSIPGNMRQQYHFACKNWARFYPLFGDKMGDPWKKEFYSWIADYSESRRPSDGNRQYAPLPVPHDLVGEPGFLLGGNPQNGGTENHKTMWRTSGLLYSQLFPDTAYISGYTVQQAEHHTKEAIRDYLKRLLITGNGEYDSQVYYPHSIEPFLNLYDFSPDAETRLLAKFALDYYFVTFGLKVIDGNIAGAQKRGYLPGSSPSEMETLLWGFFNNTSRDMSDAIASLHQVTTRYRPNSIISDIVNKNIPLPFEARMARPFYHMDHPFSFAEYFYSSENYAMGSVQMTIVDNPNQQMIWSMIAQGEDQPLAFSGGHPMRGSTSGHSPYTQVLQSKGSIIVLTAETQRVNDQENFIARELDRRQRAMAYEGKPENEGLIREVETRKRTAAQMLVPFKAPEEDTAIAYNEFWNNSKEMACTWFFYPAALTPVYKNGHWLFDAGNTYIAIIPLSKNTTLISPEKHLVEEMDVNPRNFFTSYHTLVFHGKVSGYIVETAERKDYTSIDQFSIDVARKTKTRHKDLDVMHTTLAGDEIRMQYFPQGLRPVASINNNWIDWENFTDGAVYISPYVSVKDGIMQISNGKDSYSIDFTEDLPVFSR